MATLLSKPKAEARRKGTWAALSWAATGGFGAMALLSTWSWLLPIVGAGISGWLTWRWFKHRAEWGLRF